MAPSITDVVSGTPSESSSESGGFNISKGSSEGMFDPTMQAINELYRGQLESLIGATGGLGTYGRFNPMALPGQQERDILSRIMGRMNQPLANPYETQAKQMFGNLSNP